MITKTFLRAADLRADTARIPCLVCDKNGILYAAFELRHGNGDWADIDIILTKSTDGGLTFSEPLTIVKGHGKTVNNPVLLIDRENRLHLLYCIEYGLAGIGGVYHRYSTDGGLTFSEPEDITAVTFPNKRTVFATGPTHGICLSDGTLLTPIWFVPQSDNSDIHAHHPGRVAILYSKNKGATWACTPPLPLGEVTDPNESTAAQTDDGSLYISVRDGNSHCRCFSAGSIEKGFTPIQKDDSLPDPICCGAVLQTQYGLLLSHCEDENERKNLTVCISHDNGKTFSDRIRLTTGQAGYSDIAVLPDGHIAIVYESNNETEINICIFNITEPSQETYPV